MGFLELYVVFKYENSLSSGFSRLERDREVDLNNKERKKRKMALSHAHKQ